MARFGFRQVDVFSSAALQGNPVAVVHDAEAFTAKQMWAIARWTNLSETTFVVPPSPSAAARGADYRVRIFAPGGELPFAGHPTLGSAHAWLEAGGQQARPGRVVQECGIGLVELRFASGELAFKAPELLRSGPVDNVTLIRAIAALGISVGDVRHSNWIDNGPGWIGLVLTSADAVLAIRPDLVAMGELGVGVIGPHPPDGPADYEVRAFEPSMAVGEDPVTGSVNAGFAVWLTRAGLAPPSFTVRQGTALRRSGDVTVTTDESGDIWVGGRSTTLIHGTLTL
jgi:PhzF family phenazine biosynthesis protein